VKKTFLKNFLALGNDIQSCRRSRVVFGRLDWGFANGPTLLRSKVRRLPLLFRLTAHGFHRRVLIGFADSPSRPSAGSVRPRLGCRRSESPIFGMPSHAASNCLVVCRCSCSNVDASESQILGLVDGDFADQLSLYFHDLSGHSNRCSFRSGLQVVQNDGLVD